MNRRAAALAGTLLALPLAACGTATEARARTDSEPTLTVFAAASLKQTFTALGRRYEDAHPGRTVTFNFAGSSGLLTQLQQGAPADVFASADTANMTKAADAELLAADPVNFATNTLEIAVPPGNPGKITSLADLTRPEFKVVVCAAEVPCGAATTKATEAAGVTLHPVSEESSVTDVLNKVQTGQADAGLVYRTDVTGSGGRVDGVEFGEATEAVNEYPIATLASAKDPAAADEFVALVTSDQGRRTLAEAGFGPP